MPKPMNTKATTPTCRTRWRARRRRCTGARLPAQTQQRAATQAGTCGKRRRHRMSPDRDGQGRKQEQARRGRGPGACQLVRWRAVDADVGADVHVWPRRSRASRELSGPTQRKVRKSRAGSARPSTARHCRVAHRRRRRRQRNARAGRPRAM
eukprot:15478375-Alexandrium_andersonii.AAC.1